MGINTRGRVRLSRDKSSYLEYNEGTEKVVLTVDDEVAATVDADGIDFPGDLTVAGDLDVTGAVTNDTGAGAVTTAATTAVVESGDGASSHVTKLTMTAFAVGTGGDAEDLAIGAKFYTFPTGTIMVGKVSLKGILSASIASTIADGEVGIGTVIGSTAVDTLGEVGATSENLIEGDVGVLSTYVCGTTVLQIADQAGIATLPFVILSAGVHDIFLNVAATWPNISGPAAITFDGVITIEWSKIS